jgi:aldehyde:ferredoxin oxidoreductase
MELICQRILYVDLRERRCWDEVVETEWIAGLIGGRGIGARLLWEKLGVEVEPLGLENVLLFCTGPLQGTYAPTAGRVTVITKSPLTGLYLKTGAGGHWGAALRRAGYDHVAVLGAADEPVYLRIRKGKTDLIDARDLWGMTVREASTAIQRTADGRVQIACIGPAGENLVKYANIMFSYYHSASRGGAGAVMGAKRLKAVAVASDDGHVEVTDPIRFRRAAQLAREKTYRDTMAGNLYKYGTAGDVTVFNDMHQMPSFNWTRAHVDDEAALTLGGRTWEANGYLKRRRGCSGCPISCHRFTGVDVGPYATTQSGGPQLATVKMGGPNCGVANIEAVFRFNALCNDLGLDSVSAGSSIAWLMESYEKGLIGKTQTGQVNPVWGDEEALLSLTKMIAYREGIGDLLAEETREASRSIGGESWKWAVQAKGMAPTGVLMQGALSYALAFAVNPRGPDHLHTETMAEFGATPEARAVIKRIAGDERYAVPYSVEKRAEIVRWHEDIYAVTDALGLCAFSTTCAYGITEDLLAELFETATGFPSDPQAIMESGRRIVTLERCFNVREGLRRRDDTLPWRIMNERNLDLTGVPDSIITQEKLDAMLDSYYQLHGWHIASGVPTEKALRTLGLGFTVAAIRSREADEG